jgi:hypothetical protein
VISPVTDVTGDAVVRALAHLALGASNARSLGDAEVLRRYYQWAGEAVQTLSRLVRESDLNRLILTLRHWHLSNGSH